MAAVSEEVFFFEINLVLRSVKSANNSTAKAARGPFYGAIGALKRGGGGVENFGLPSAKHEKVPLVRVSHNLLAARGKVVRGVIRSSC
jgi:hypothetical protein